MKKFLVAAVCAFSAMAVSAQSFFSTEKSEDGIVFGVRAGLVGAGASIKGGNESLSLDSRMGFNAGVNVDIPLMQSLHVQTGLFFQQKGAKWEEEGYTEKYNPTYLQLPVLASYRYAFSDACELQVNVGPYFALGLGGKAKMEEGDELVEDDFFGGENDEESMRMKKFDMGLQFGAGVTVAKHYYLGFSYDLGLTNIARGKKETWKNRAWMINLGYNF